MEEENHNENYKALKAAMPLAEEAVKEAYRNQVEIVEKQYQQIKNMPGISNVSFIRAVPREGEGLLRRNGFVICFNEIYGGTKDEELKEILHGDEYRIFNYIEPSLDPLGYRFGLSIKFPENKKNITIDSEKGKIIPINSKNLESKLRDIGLNPSLVKKSITKYNKEKRSKESIYQVFFNYVISELEIRGFKRDQLDDLREEFRKGIREPLEDAVNHIVNLELK
ncbi:MAG: hypothetical protein PHV16_00655 [Candidatus Nanoarchaeia archaeon]|nr:hypothetical protein [Candidatus Nanoarchaeia archaeon]